MPRQRGRRVPPPDPKQIRKSAIVTEIPTEEAWDRAEQQRTLDKHVIAAGCVQNSATGAWHTWVSLYGSDLSSWYVGADPSNARAILLAIETHYRAFDGSQDWQDSLLALMDAAQELSSDPLGTLPDAQVKELLAQVAESQQRKN
jgi:hypothetical protein